MTAPVRYGDRGPAVLELQRALIELLGPDALPRYGADGSLGAEGWAALQRAADRYRIDPLPAPARGAIVWPDLVEALLAGAEDDDAPVLTATPECSGLVCEAAGGYPVYDLRSERVFSRPQIRMDGPGRPHVRRPERVLGVVLHQCGVPFGVSAAQLERAGGDRALALATRALRIAAHATTFRADPDGAHGPLIAIAAPLLVHVNGGNGCNPVAINCEVDGLYRGLVKHAHRPRGEALSEETALAACAMLRWIVEHAALERIDLRYLWAHRQSSATRRGDPGEEAWRYIADWARRELGLAWQPERTWGDGRPLAREWGAPGGVAY